MKFKTRKKFIIVGALILLTLVLVGCQPTEVEVIKEVEVQVTVVVEPTAVPPEPYADQSAYHADWEAGPHSTYDITRGPNDWCARCHSPQNWNPEATVGAAPNCVSCKMFAEITVGDGNDLVLEEDWFAIPCESCHVMVDGFATELAYLNPITMEYKAVSNSTELCEQCHVTTTGNAFGSAVDHKITLGGSAHLNYGGFIGDVAPPTFCADCHDPHTTEPTQCIDCHAGDVDTADHAGGMYGVMKDTVTCMACHDASGADVGPHPDEDNDLWVPQVTTVGRGGPSTDAIVSHSIVFTVACDRCHYEDNAYELTVLTAAGAVPEPPAEE